MGGARDQLAASDRADQNGHEGRAFDQRIAGGELADRQLVRQHGVFHRSEQCRDDAEHAQRDKQQRDRMQEEAKRGKPGGEDLCELQPARHDSLDVSVGQLATEPGQDEEGKDEDRSSHRHQRIPMRCDRAVEQHDDQRVLQDVVVQRRGELRPEQRSKPARRH